uniref:Uncharacterized protein n=1 Tax=Ciona savignyi TaxID=51511 RepID=H2ZPN3_CIOSA
SGSFRGRVRVRKGIFWNLLRQLFCKNSFAVVRVFYWFIFATPNAGFVRFLVLYPCINIEVADCKLGVHVNIAHCYLQCLMIRNSCSCKGQLIRIHSRCIFI